jgi:hypothetical protein
VTLFTAAPPAAQILGSGGRFEISIPHGIGLGCLALIGWVAGLWIARHPFRHELRLIGGRLRARAWRAREMRAETLG